MKIVVRRGLDVAPKSGAPITLAEAAPISRVGLVASDHPNLRLELLVAEGDVVAVGTPVFRDKARPEIVFVSSVSGTVASVTMGQRRRISSVTVAPSGDNRRSFDTTNSGTAEGLRSLMLSSGFWPHLRQRPFDRIPSPDTVPDAIFITAMDTKPAALDPHETISGREEAFSRGVVALAALTSGPVYICQSGPERLLEDTDRIKTVQFIGRHPAGLPGTHINRLFRPVGGRVVWHLDAQDVVALGHLLATGSIEATRTIAIAGPGVRQPHKVSVALGSDLHALVRQNLTPGQKTILSGSMLDGRESQFLLRHHRQLTVLDVPAPRKENWLVAALRRSATTPALIPTQALEQSLGADMPVVPLLRALSIGDAERADNLGCRLLAEDDLALATYLTGGTMNFGVKLREVLDMLEEET